MMNWKALLAALAVAGSTACAATLDAAPALSARPPDAEPIELPARPGTPPGRLRVTRVAHASVLLDFDGALVLTDPWFSEKAGYHHGEPLGIELERLPKLDLVVASHAHYDHFDIKTFARYPHKDVPFLVGPDMVDDARAAGFTNVRELRPWERAEAGPFVVTATPAQHGVPEIGFVIEARGFTVFFAGDSKLVAEHDELPVRFPSIDLVLPAINGLRVFGKRVVMNPEDAATLARTTRAKVVVPTHYTFAGSWFTDTFILGRDGSVERFLAAMKERAPSSVARVLPPGQSLDLVRPAPLALRLRHDALTWEPRGDARYALLRGDPSRGAFSMLLELPAGLNSEWHTHASDKDGLVLSGRMVHTLAGDASETLLDAGSYFFIPAGVPHATRCLDDAACVLLYRQDGPFDRLPAVAPEATGWRDTARVLSMVP